MIVSDRKGQRVSRRRVCLFFVLYSLVFPFEQHLEFMSFAVYSIGKEVVKIARVFYTPTIVEA